MISYDCVLYCTSKLHHSEVNSGGGVDHVRMDEELEGEKASGSKEHRVRDIRAQFHALKMLSRYDMDAWIKACSSAASCRETVRI